MDPTFLVGSSASRFVQDNAALLWDSAGYISNPTPPAARIESHSQQSLAAALFPHPIDGLQAEGGLLNPGLNNGFLIDGPWPNPQIPFYSNDRFSIPIPAMAANSSSPLHHVHVAPVTPPPRRNRSTYWPAQGVNGGPNILWDNDEVLTAEQGQGQQQTLATSTTTSTTTYLPPNSSGGNIITDDPYLVALAEDQFSSPSSYPPFLGAIPSANASSSSISSANSRSNITTSTDAWHRAAQQAATVRQVPAPPQVQAVQAVQAPAQAQTQRPSGPPRPNLAGPFAASNSAPRGLANHPSNSAAGACAFTLPGPQRSETQLSSSTITTTVDSQNTSFSIDSPEHVDPRSLFITPSSSFDASMPPVTRRSRPAPELASSPPLEASHRSKRRRTSAAATPRTTSQRKPASSRAQPTEIKDFDNDDCLFDDSRNQATPGAELKSDDVAAIDLTEANEVPEELKKPVVDKRVKLWKFQCVICMDDAANLTLTHCGHMFCAECLHSSLHVEATRGKCPMCRQKLDMKARESYNTKTKGFWPLEIKIMTATRKGKRKARTF